MNTISIYELKKITNPIIIDIRDNYSYNISHIKSAINIPYYNLLNNYSHYLNKNNIYLLGRIYLTQLNYLDIFYLI